MLCALRWGRAGASQHRGGILGTARRARCARCSVLWWARSAVRLSFPPAPAAPLTAPPPRAASALQHFADLDDASKYAGIAFFMQFNQPPTVRAGRPRRWPPASLSLLAAASVCCMLALQPPLLCGQGTSHSHVWPRQRRPPDLPPSAFHPPTERHLQPRLRLSQLRPAHRRGECCCRLLNRSND